MLYFVGPFWKMAAIEVKGHICDGPIAKIVCSYHPPNFMLLSSYEQFLHQSA